MARLFRQLGTTTDRLWVELTVSSADVGKGLNTRTPGRKLFSGLWYGKDPLDFRNYGKMVEPGFAVPVGCVNERSPQRTLDRLR
jgi:hypothetical protein